MGGLFLVLLIVGLLVYFYGRWLWDKDYREGMKYAKQRESWEAGYEKGKSGQTGCAVLVFLLVTLTMVATWMVLVA